jgi:hypothetical protein
MREFIEQYDSGNGGGVQREQCCPARRQGYDVLSVVHKAQKEAGIELPPYAPANLLV